MLKSNLYPGEQEFTHIFSCTYYAVAGQLATHSPSWSKLPCGHDATHAPAKSFIPVVPQRTHAPSKYPRPAIHVSTHTPSCVSPGHEVRHHI